MNKIWIFAIALVFISSLAWSSTVKNTNENTCIVVNGEVITDKVYEVVDIVTTTKKCTKTELIMQKDKLEKELAAINEMINQIDNL